MTAATPAGPVLTRFEAILSICMNVACIVALGVVALTVSFSSGAFFLAELCDRVGCGAL